MKIILAAGILALASTPLLARPAGGTHDLVWQPSGKTPAAMHRPRERAHCDSAARHHQAGKTMLAAPRCDSRAAAPAADGAAAVGGEAGR